MKRVWIEIDGDVVIFDSHTGDPIVGWANDEEWGLKEAYEYVERWGFRVTHEVRPLDATHNTTEE